MTTRTMGPASGWRWLVAAVNLGGSNPKAVFGGAALLMLAVFAAAMVLSIAMTTLLPANATAQFAGSLLVSLPLLALMAALMIGYLRLIDAVEHGRPASATQVFSGFADRSAWLHAVVILLVLALLQYLLMAGAVMLVAPEAGQWYLENMTNPPADPEQMVLPPGIGRAFAVAAVVGVLVYAAQALGLGQVALRGKGAGAALADGAAGAVRNVLPLVVLMLVGLAAMLVVGMVVAVLVVLLAAVAGGGGTATALGMLVGVPVYLLLVLAMVVVSFGVMYAMWRDICGDGVGPRADSEVMA